MKKNMGALSALTLAVLLLGGCEKAVLDFRNAEIVNGKIYNSGANTPFSGMVTNVPDTEIFLHQAGFDKFARVIVQVLGISNENMDVGYGVYGGMLLRKSVCDIQVDDGVLNGKVICKAPESEQVRIKAAFSKGALNGDLMLYAPQGDSDPLASAEFDHGNLDGKEEVYSPNTHKLVHVIHWKGGVVDGMEESFDQATENRILSVNWVDGKLDGTLTAYAPDGERVTQRGKYDHGAPIGVHEMFDPKTGKLISHAEFVNGKLQGHFQQWDANGKLISDKTYADGVEVAAPSTNNAAASGSASTSLDGCVDEWASAYRKTSGEDAMVTNDQMEEWKTQCMVGQHPA